MAPTERDRITHITHGDLALHNPVPVDKLDETLGLIGLEGDDVALDVGCGQGELLLRLAVRAAAGRGPAGTLEGRFRGLGIDTSEPAIEAARARAAARLPSTELEFRVEDAMSSSLAEGAFGFAACVGSSHALGGLRPTADRLAALVRPGGFVLIGDGYWRADPPQAYLDALGGATRDELPELAGLVEACEAAGLRSVWLTASSEDDWDRYEWTLIANGERWAAEHPDDPLTAPLLAWVDRARRRVLAPGGRTSLGFALVLLRRPPD